jgi:hypothetical protein
VVRGVHGAKAPSARVMPRFASVFPRNSRESCDAGGQQPGTFGCLVLSGSTLDDRGAAPPCRACRRRHHERGACRSTRTSASNARETCRKPFLRGDVGPPSR